MSVYAIVNQDEKIKKRHSSRIQEKRDEKRPFTTGYHQEKYRTRSATDFRALVIVKIVLGLIGSVIMSKIRDTITGDYQE